VAIRPVHPAWPTLGAERSSRIAIASMRTVVPLTPEPPAAALP
jgi:hypothetical protein